MSQNVLLITDDPDIAETVRLSLEGTGPILLRAPDSLTYRLEWVRRCADALARIANGAQPARGVASCDTAGAPAGDSLAASGAEAGSIAAILVDLRLPDSLGIDIVGLLLRAAPHIPILVLSSAADEALARSTLLLGAQDYLLNSRIDGYILPKLVRDMIGRSAIASAPLGERGLTRVSLDSPGDAVMAADIRGRVRYLNAEAERLTGWSLAEAAGKSVREVFGTPGGPTLDAIPAAMALATQETLPNRRAGATVTSDAVGHRAVAAGLRRAVENSELALHYQPQVDLETGFIVGVEALLRWYREDRAVVPTAHFVCVAEECGLIVPIGRWVLKEACRQARAWLDAGLVLPRLSVNISEAELRARDFVAALREILTEIGLPPKYLELELTETFLIRDLPATAAVFGALKEIGVRLALDDFGTGYSSLSHLRALPINTLKIDQSFVRDSTVDVGVGRIVSAVIGLGESLGMEVVAEGVETAEQQAFLLDHGCRVGQGYLFARPMHAVAITTMLALQAADTGRSGTTPLILRANP